MIGRKTKDDSIDQIPEWSSIKAHLPHDTSVMYHWTKALNDLNCFDICVQYGNQSMEDSERFSTFSNLFYKSMRFFAFLCHMQMYWKSEYLRVGRRDDYWRERIRGFIVLLLKTHYVIAERTEKLFCETGHDWGTSRSIDSANSSKDVNGRLSITSPICSTRAMLVSYSIRAQIVGK